MLEYWFWVTAPLVVFIVAGLLIYLTGRHPKKKEPGKEETYTCGEQLPDITVQADNFYQAIRKTLRLRRVQQLHTGDMADYLLWLVVGLTLIIILVASI